MSIAARAVAMVVATGEVGPFVVIEQPSGQVVHATIVTQNSVRAMIVGRRIVKDHATDAVAYAIVSDTFIRVEGKRMDAVFVEHAMLGDVTAEIVAYPYTRVDGALSLAAPIPADRRPSALLPFDPHALPWGGITPDMYRQHDNHAVHVVNHHLASDEDVTRTVRFLRNRALVFARNLPEAPPAVQRAFIDVRGRDVSIERRTDLVTRLADAMRATFMEEEG